MVRMMSVVAVMIAALLCAGQALALDRGTIERWMASMQELQAYGDELEEGFDEPVDPEADPLDFERMLREFTEHHPEVDGIIRNHGFADGDEWANTGGRIIGALMTLQMEEGAEERDAEIAAALREIEESPHLTDGQKAMMREQMEQQMQVFDRMTGDVSDADVEAVRAMEEELLTFFDDQ